MSDKRTELLENESPTASELEATAFKQQSSGYDPIGGGDLCTCGGQLRTVHESSGMGGAMGHQVCTRCGKDPAAYEPSGKDIISR